MSCPGCLSSLGHREWVDELEFLVIDLTELMGMEFDIYRSLLSLLQEERSAFVDGSVEDLIQTCKKKDNLILKIRIVEQSREAILEKLANRMGLSRNELTLSNLEQRLKQPFATHLQTLRSNLSAILQSVQEMNEENQVYLQHSVDFVKRSLHLIRYLTVSSSKYVASRALDGDRLDGRSVSEKA